MLIYDYRHIRSYIIIRYDVEMAAGLAFLLTSAETSPKEAAQVLEALREHRRLPVTSELAQMAVRMTAHESCERPTAGPPRLFMGLETASRRDSSCKSSVRRQGIGDRLKGGERWMTLEMQIHAPRDRVDFDLLFFAALRSFFGAIYEVI